VSCLLTAIYIFYVVWQQKNVEFISSFDSEVIDYHNRQIKNLRKAHVLLHEHLHPITLRL